MPMSTKRKAPAKLAAPVVKSSAKLPVKSTIDESRAAISATDGIQSSNVETIDISSDADSDEDVSDDDAEQLNGDKEAPRINGKQIGLPSPNHSSLPDDAEESDGEATSPSFGELLRGNETIDVPALLQQSSAPSNALAQIRTSIIPPSHQSLTTVLSQALRTDDTDLLESCLHTTDLPTIRNTIERIDSTLAGTLLIQLASRLHRRPGRAGNLMTWVQWTLVAHGGALASQPKVIHSLSGLQKVLSDRAKGLGSLLALKGKLDLLEGQMDLRRNMQRSSGLSQAADGSEEDEHLIWVEGETDNVSEKNLANGIPSRRKRAAADDDDDDVPVMNGFVGDSEDEEDDSADEEEDSDAAEESLDEDEVDHDDVDESMGEDEESDVEAAPPSKVQKVARFFKRK